jgi:pyrimidine deaminase RibD-like protein
LNTNRDPREVAIGLLNRSIAKVQVAAVLSDSRGIFSWGWNYSIGERGVHAEEHAIARANKKRLAGSKLTVAGRKKKSKSFVYARPCSKPRRDAPTGAPCLELVRKYSIGTVEYTTKDGTWELVRLL